MLDLLITAGAAVYLLVVVLCWELGYPRMAKAGFVIIVVGMILSGTSAMALSRARLWEVPFEQLDAAMQRQRLWIIVGCAGQACVGAGAIISLGACLVRVIRRRREALPFLWRSRSG